jgi:hypothetical protein
MSDHSPFLRLDILSALHPRCLSPAMRDKYASAGFVLHSAPLLLNCERMELGPVLDTLELRKSGGVVRRHLRNFPLYKSESKVAVSSGG